jgi:hypothetical protein
LAVAAVVAIAVVGVSLHHQECRKPNRAAIPDRHPERAIRNGRSRTELASTTGDVPLHVGFTLDGDQFGPLARASSRPESNSAIR